MNTKRIVITGGPGTGKSSLIKHLELNGLSCKQEISREIILKAREEGYEQLFLKKPLLFSEMLIEGRLKQYQKTTAEESILYYDRGLPDVVAYLNFISLDYPESFDELCLKYRYDSIFILPPWEEIYVQDNERYESFDEAAAIYYHLNETYKSYQYNPIEVPPGTLIERTSFILAHS
ncbi:MAG TPA: ATP-binding protein [Flavobacteriaceae bacterium]|nr:ATP-binding protein [Flavobacteriaceae bacterium]